MRTKRIEDMAQHYARDDVAREYASADFLVGPESLILEELRPRLASAHMLDIGVGGGRTTVHFGPLVRNYVGIDFSAAMIEACERRFPARGASMSFLVADARAMDLFPDGSFDFVLFSLNGLDVVGDHEDRLRALREIHRVCRTGAVFCFCSSNLASAESSYSLSGMAGRAMVLLRSQFVRRPRRLLRELGYLVRWRVRNPSPRTLRRLGHAVLVGERPRWELKREFFASSNEQILAPQYYITPMEQVRQLEDSGFHNVRIFAGEGEEVTRATMSGLPSHWRLYYLCSKA